MLSLKIYCFEKVKQDFVKAGEGEYLKRLKTLAKVEVRHLSAGKGSERSQSACTQKEAALLLERVRGQDFLVVLDEGGSSMTSSGLAEFFQKKMTGGCSSLSFAVGGTYGWDPSVLKRANLVLSLSSFTFTAELSRLILIEQLYRAMTILNNQSYHK